MFAQVWREYNSRHINQPLLNYGQLMRFSQLFGKTLREAPANVTLLADQLAMRAAMKRRSTMPLGYRVIQKIWGLIEESAARLDGQEANLNIQDDNNSEYQSDIKSYRDLPKYLFHLGGGERYMGSSLHANQVDFEAGYRAIYHSLLEVFRRCELTVSAVEFGKDRTSFVVPHSQGLMPLLVCQSRDCGYASIADFADVPIQEGISSSPKPLTKVETPHCATIAALAEFLKIETRQTIKAVMYSLDDEEFVFVVIRGDLDVSEAKLFRVLKHGINLQPATEAEIIAAGAVPGYASPTGLKVAASLKERGKGVVYVIADPSIQSGANFAAGANEAGYHFINVNYPRDFQVTAIADIALASEATPCPRCGSPLRSEQAFVLGSCEKIGPTALTYLTEAGRPEPVWLGTYRLQLGQIMTCIIDQHHDEAGIVWPAAVAPYDVHLVRLGKALETIQAADKLYEDLQAAGRTVLYDDRDEASAGVKFTDADLIGIPLRITISDKSLKAGGVEVKRRDSVEKTVVALEASHLV